MIIMDASSEVKVIVLLSVLTFVTVSSQNDPNDNRYVTVNTFGSCASADGKMENEIGTCKERIAKLESQVAALLGDDIGPWGGPRDCCDVRTDIAIPTGVYEIWPEGVRPFKALCINDGEHIWTAIQQRFDASTSFDRAWSEYKNGFGTLATFGNMWMGLERMHRLTQQGQYLLRIDITNWEGITKYAEYEFFHVGDEASGYRLKYDYYRGDADDGLGDYHQEAKFTTLDEDNDRNPQDNCAKLHGGAWWYNDCDRANLNGPYRVDYNLDYVLDRGIEWDVWLPMYSFKAVVMRIRPRFRTCPKRPIS